MPEFQPYLDTIALHYEKWWKLYTLTDAEGQEERSVESFFDFGSMVQTIGQKDEPELGDRCHRSDVARWATGRHIILGIFRRFGGMYGLLIKVW